MIVDAYLAAHILDLENHIQRLERRADRQILREIEEPFDLTDVEFRELYRLTPELISDLIDVLVPHLMHTRITELSVEKQAQFSMTLEARRIAVEQFQNARQPFEGAIGAIDCTHVAILAPREHKEAYINHNGYHSLNVQMICDSNLKILNVNTRFPGARHARLYLECFCYAWCYGTRIS